MNLKKEPLEDGGWLGRFARWAAEPYLAFKDDHLRLYALMCRDARKIFITALVLYYGQHLPWRALVGLFG